LSAVRAVRLVAALLLGTCALATGVHAQPATAQEQRMQRLIMTGIEQRREHKIRASIETLSQALTLARASGSFEREVSALSFLALSYRELPDLAKVLETRRQVLDVVRAHPEVFAANGRRDEPWALHALAGAYYLQKDLPNALRFSRAAVEFEVPHVTPADTIGIARFRQFLGQLLFAGGELRESEQVLRQAVADFETRLGMTRRLNPDGPTNLAELGFELGVLRTLQEVLVAQGRTDEALEVAEQSRARTLAASQGKASSAVAPATLAEMKALARSYRSTLVVYTVAYALDPDLLLEFSGFVDARATALLIWVLRPDGTSGFRRVALDAAGKSLRELIADARTSIGASGRGGARGPSPSGAGPAVTTFAALQALDRLLVEPIQPLLPDDADSRVMLLPQDLLYTVPFAALQDRSGRFLAARHTLFFNPSVAALRLESQLLQQAARRARGVLVVGNPAMPSLPAPPGQRAEPLPDLPQALDEANEIAALFGARALSGPAATKQAVVERMRSARIVHLATHGLMDRDPERAQYFNSLAFAPARGDAGFLQAREIGALQLSAELVVLSACDTADGKPIGDGVLGFSSVFLAAGVPSTLVAQWSIPDASTAALMRSFYAELLRGTDKALALRRAMLATLKAYPHPAHWAAFVLMGEPTNGEALAGVKGNSAVAQSAAATGVQIPLPADVQRYSESRDAADGTLSAMFGTRLSIADLLAFYRSAYAADGFREQTALANVERSTASIVLVGPQARKLVVQIVEFDDASVPAGKTRWVTLRLERAP
jgi:tetratricopeptide (TPR) repeat protein